jgi:hypothetical protein
MAQDEIASDQLPNITIRERIDSNIKDVKDSIKTVSHYIKALIRESLGH